MARNGPDVEIIARRTAYKRFFQMDILNLRHRLFGGGMTAEIEREIFVRRPAVAVLPYDPARDAVVLIEQFRSGALLSDLSPWQLEVIAGLVEPGEDAVDVARRESLEEAACAIHDPIEVCRYLTSPGGTNEIVTFICARADSTGLGGVHGLDHEHEDIRVHVLDRRDAMRRIDTGQIANALAIIGLQWLTLHLDEVKERWR
ncbi:MAG: NUDIX domain-containing protein [Alphaproteobacteria bacterium]